MGRSCLGLFIAVVMLLLSGIHALGQASAAQERLEEEFKQIAAVLQLSDGSTVADVGAGGGTWTRFFAQLVGPRGHVFATEVRKELVDSLRSSTLRRRLDNVTVVFGSQQDTMLPDHCCDAALLRLVYHAFDDPGQMRASLRRAIKPMGRLLIIDFRPSPEDLGKELSTVGFELVELIPTWRGRPSVYGALFRSLP